MSPGFHKDQLVAARVRTITGLRLEAHNLIVIQGLHKQLPHHMLAARHRRARRACVDGAVTVFSASTAALRSREVRQAQRGLSRSSVGEATYGTTERNYENKNRRVVPAGDADESCRLLVQLCYIAMIGAVLRC